MFRLHCYYSLLGNVYIVDTNNQCVRKVTVSTGIISTIAGSGGTGSYSGDNGPATAAGLNNPGGVTLDSAGTYSPTPRQRNSLFHYTILGNVYIADSSNNRVRKVTVSTGIITTYAGTGASSYSGDNGPATSAAVYYPQGVSLDASGSLVIPNSFVFFADFPVHNRQRVHR